MPATDRVTIELYVDDQGTVKIRQAKAATEDLANASVSGSRASTAAAEDFASALVKKLGIYALLTTAAYKLGDALVSGFKMGIKAQDDFQMTTIGVAATLTDMAAGGIKAQAAYAQNIAYSRNMYNELQLAAARHFATGAEMIQGWNILAQKGIVLEKDQIDNLGIIVDKVKLLTVGQTSSIQIAQELRGMLSGQARQTDQLAILIKDKYGEAWKDIVEKHRQAGDLLSWLAGEFKGLAAASEDIVNTLTAQKATLETNLSIVGREGLQGAYQDIVGLLKQANQYLTEHKDELAGKIVKTWDGIKGAVAEIAKGIASATVELVNFGAQLSSIAKNPLIAALWGGAAGSRLGPWGAAAGAIGGFGAAMQARNYDEVEAGLMRGSEFGGYEEPLLGSLGYSANTGKAAPTIKGAGPGKGGGGGGSAESAQNTVQKFIESMKQLTAQAAGDTEATLRAWYAKQEESLSQWAAKGANITEAEKALKEAYYAKLKKLDDDFTAWYQQNMGYQYEALKAQENKKVKEVEGNAQKVAQVYEVYAKKRMDLDSQVETNSLNLFKGYYDTLASLNPTLEGQLRLKQQALELENRLAQAALERQIRESKISPALADEARAMQAMVAQAKQFDLAMQNDKSLSGWAYGRVKSEQQKNTWADAMEGAESFITDAFSQGIQGALSKTKTDFSEVAKTMATSFVLNLAKQGIHYGFTKIAEGILGDKGVAQLGASRFRPMYVSVVNGGGGLGLGSGEKSSGAGGGLLGSYAGGTSLSSYGGSEVDQVTAMWSDTQNYLSNVFSMGSTELTASANTYGSMFASSTEGLLGAAGSWGGMFGSAISSLLGAFGGGGGGGGGGGAFGIIGSVVSIASSIFSFFHEGGVIRAHSGWPGLASDEVPIIAQTGERVLNRRQNRDYEAGIRAGNGGAQYIHLVVSTPPVVLDGQTIYASQKKHVRVDVQDQINKGRIRV